MREQLDLRQSDIQWGERRATASMTASMKTVAEKMVQKGKMTQEVQEFVTNLMEEIKQRQEKKE
jgi:polyhydroxyalkanoate synthesis regulator phasin